MNKTLEQAPQKGMRWVKASERLPEIWKCHGSASEKVPIKLYGEFFHVGRIVKNGGRIKFEILDGKNPTDFESESFHLIEWLDESIPTLTIQQALEVWEDACKDLLKDIAQVFLDKSNQAKADTLRDAEVFQAVGETIENFPLRDKRTYFLNKFGIDIDKIKV